MSLEKKENNGKSSVKAIVICGIIFLVIVIVATFFITKKIYNKKDDKGIMTMTQVTTTISTDVLEEKIKDIGELATIEYLYTDAGKFDEDEKFDSGWFEGMKVPFSGKSFIARWDGRIKAGIDVSNVSIKVEGKDKKIIIGMPEAEILSNEVFEDSFETLDESKNIFNQIEVEDVNNFIGENKKFMERKAKSNGLLEDAEENAKVFIQNSLESMEVIKDNYEIIFEELSEDEESENEESNE